MNPVSSNDHTVEHVWGGILIGASGTTFVLSIAMLIRRRCMSQSCGSAETLHVEKLPLLAVRSNNARLSPLLRSGTNSRVWTCDDHTRIASTKIPAAVMIPLAKA
jgi:hypothetical protein